MTDSNTTKSLPGPEPLFANNPQAAAAALSELPPADIPGYEFVCDEGRVRELGRGGMGRVYEARQLGTDRIVALKIIDKNSDTQGRHGFLAEAKKQARFEHPNIVLILDAGEDNGRLWIAMERMDGTLAKRLKDKNSPIPARDAANLALTLSNAVQVAHSKGIVHLDLKPANIFFKNETPKIADFGLARLLGSEAQVGGVVVGSVAYMSPEQACGKGLGAASDIWALGVILYQLLCDRLPFGGDSRSAIAAIQEQDPVPPRMLRRDVPEDLQTICLKCLSKDPRHRYASAAELSEDLQRYLDGMPIRARPAGPMEHFWKWCRRRPLVASLAAGLMVAVVTGFAMVTWFWLLAEDRLDEALKARVRAETAELDRQLAAADIAADTGRWHEARAIYATALDHPRLAEERGQLVRLKIIRASVFLNDRSSVEVGLDKLRNEKIDSQLRSRLEFETALDEMHRGIAEAVKNDLSLGADLNSHERRAIDILTRLKDDEALDQADRWTVRGLLAANPKEALAAYEFALRARPFHPYAQANYIVTSLLSGRMQEALARVQVWAAATPEDPLPWFYQAFILTLLKRHEDADAALAQLRKAPGGGRKLPADSLEHCALAIKVTRLIDEEMTDVAIDGFRAFGFLLKLQACVPEKADFSQFVLFTAPLSPKQRQSLGAYFEAARLGMMPFGDARKGLDTLERVGPFVPEGFQEFTRALLYVRLPAKDRAREFGQKKKAADSAKRAAELPSFWDVRVICWLSLANYSIGAMRLPEFAPEANALRADARYYLLQSAQQPRLSSTARGSIRAIAAKLEDPNFSADIETFLKRAKN